MYAWKNTVYKGFQVSTGVFESIPTERGEFCTTVQKSAINMVLQSSEWESHHGIYKTRFLGPICPVVRFGNPYSNWQIT